MARAPIQLVPGAVPAAPAPVFQSQSDVRTGAFNQGAQGLVVAGRGLEQLSNELTGVGLDILRQDNETEARDLDVQLSEAIRGVTYGDPEAGEPGYFASRQKVAIDGYAPASEALDTAITSILDTASNDAVRRRATELAAARREAAVRRMDTHLLEQRNAYTEDRGQARIAQAAADASAGWGDQSMMARSLGIMETEVTAWAERNGVAPEVAAVELLKQQTVAVKGAFDQAIAADRTGTAMSILTLNSARIDPAVYATMRKTMLDQTRAASAQALVASAQAKFPGQPEKWRSYIKDVASGQVEDDALARVDRDLSAAREEWRFQRSRVAAERTDETEARRRIINEGATAEDVTGLVAPDRVDELYAAAQRQREDKLGEDAIRQANHDHTVEQRNRARVLRNAQVKAEEFFRDPEAETVPTMEQFRATEPEVYTALQNEGKLDQYVTLQRNLEKGQRYRAVSDGETLVRLLKSGNEVLSQVEAIRWQGALTETEYGQLQAAVVSATEVMRKQVTDPGLVNSARISVEKMLPKRFGTPAKRIDKLRDEKEAVVSSVQRWIMDQQKAGAKLNQFDVDRRTAELLIEIEAESPAYFSNFEGVAAQGPDMTAGERATVRVDRENIPIAMERRLLTAAGQLGVPQVSESRLERLAGAVAIGDYAQVAPILGITSFDDLPQEVQTDVALGAQRLGFTELDPDVALALAGAIMFQDRLAVNRLLSE